jgi:hypothetical protein
MREWGVREFLLLCNRPARGSNANTILEHIEAIHQMPGYRVWEISMIGNIPALLDLNQFDAVGIHYSIHLNDPNDHFLTQRAIERLSSYKGHKCIWMHDEYRLVDDTIAKLNRIGIDTLFTVIPEVTARRIYGTAKLPNTKVVTVLTGYVSPELEEIEAFWDDPRPVDVSYRARRPPFWLGELGQDKVRIGQRFLAEGKPFDLEMNISVEEADRLYDKHWLDLLLKSKASLSSESGASIVDFTGRIEQQVDQYVTAHPNAEFEDVRNIVAAVDYEYVINCISPRIFEMVACRTLIVAFPGEYSRLIEPWVHYVPLNKDFSNLAEVVRAIQSPETRQRITERAYQDIIGSRKYSYDVFSRLCADQMDLPERTAGPLHQPQFYFSLFVSPTYVARNVLSRLFQRYILASGLRADLIRTWLKLPRPVQQFLKPLLRLVGR